jgi:hypothetical protein
MRVIILDSPEKRMRALDAVRSAPINADTPFCVVVRPYERMRSREQNRRYWAMLCDIAEQANPQGTYYSADSWHEYFAGKWLPKTEIRLPNSDTTIKRKSTTELTSAEFGDYMTKLEAWCAEHDIQILDDY